MTNIGFHFYDNHPRQTDFFEEVISGLNHPSKTLPTKFLYDERGSYLFEVICKTPEYYPTRSETEILEQHAQEMAHFLGPSCLLLEPGSGNSEKICLLLEELSPKVYMPIDISKGHLLSSAQALAISYPWLEIHAVCADFSRELVLPFSSSELRKVVFFPGSSISNFETEEAQGFLEQVAQLIQPDGGLLIGVDLKKDTAILNRAYNDAQEVTAAFNLNLLRHINRELGANFNTEAFRHWAFYNESQGRVEMHLVSLQDQVVTIGTNQFHFEEGETVHTENSYKYSIEEFQRLAVRAGFQPKAVWSDSQYLFSVHYLSTTSH